ncbi:MAG TPA: helix-turn-helix domain-containing protein [Demequina sp.]|nr:helix-turn-helix domain-containing protein [Demequina sp.]
MVTQSGGAGASTYMPESEDLAEIIDFVRVLGERGVEVPEPQPALVDREGRRVEIPGPVFEALRQVVTAMSRGQGVTIAPHNTMLTTQEAADFLGISRPTLVRLLTDGEIPFELRGRHRRVMLAHLLDYQDRSRTDRRAALDGMVREGEAAGLYDLHPTTVTR